MTELPHDAEIGVLLEAGEIPLGSEVTKRTGEKRYILRDKVVIYLGDGVKQEIKAMDGALFLTHNNGDVSALPATTRLLWWTDRNTLADFLQAQLVDDDQ